MLSSCRRGERGELLLCDITYETFLFLSSSIYLIIGSTIRKQKEFRRESHATAHIRAQMTLKTVLFSENFENFGT